MRTAILSLLLALGAALPAAKTVVDVYYFHGNARCMSCNKMEAYTKEAVEQGFAADVKKGLVKLHIVNLQAPGNEHYISEFKIGSKAVVVARSVGGKPESFRSLDKVWLFLRDKEKFQDYVRKNVAAAKKAA